MMDGYKENSSKLYVVMLSEGHRIIRIRATRQCHRRFCCARLSCLTRRWIDPGGSPLRLDAARIFLIILPRGRIGLDVSPDDIHFPFVADDVFVIVALPEFCDHTRTILCIQFLCGLIFKIRHDLSQCTAMMM